MSESKLLPTLTRIVYNDDGTANIIVTYRPSDSDQLPNTLLAFLPQSVGRFRDKNFVEGDLVMLLKHSPTSINYKIDEAGDLILFDSTGDGGQYYIDEETGDLMYNYPEDGGIGYMQIGTTFEVS
jgi:hypothetical protein